MKKVISFLKKLEKNNDRDWFNSNKDQFEEAKEEFTVFVEKLIAGISRFDPLLIGTDAKNCLFRIYRDVRFSKDKRPYKINFGASINPGGRKSPVPGYYIHIQPGASFLAGGKYMPSAPELLAIRNSIVKEPKAILKISNAKLFKEYFAEISGERLKTAPKGFDKDHQMIEYLQLKSFIANHDKLSHKTILDPAFDKYAVKVFKAMKPLNDFLREVI